jgi:hypothetical protein
MAEQHRKTGWLARRRERKLLKQQRRGDSPEKRAEHHPPPADSMDVMLKLGGIERESRFKK